MDRFRRGYRLLLGAIQQARQRLKVVAISRGVITRNGVPVDLSQEKVGEGAFETVHVHLFGSIEFVFVGVVKWSCLCFALFFFGSDS